MNHSVIKLSSTRTHDIFNYFDKYNKSKRLSVTVKLKMTVEEVLEYLN